MSVAKKERFIRTNLRILIDTGGDNTFPPERVNYEDKRLSLLGASNKDDLAPVTIDTLELQKAATYGQMGQFVYVNENGDFYDLFLYKDEIEEIILYGIRTRQLPEKETKKKGEAV
jgi:hypothetical protein